MRSPEPVFPHGCWCGAGLSRLVKLFAFFPVVIVELGGRERERSAEGSLRPSRQASRGRCGRSGTGYLTARVRARARARARLVRDCRRFRGQSHGWRASERASKRTSQRANERASGRTNEQAARSWCTG